MTTKTMDSESYLANLESADEQNYGVTDIDVTHSEYIKKSDVLAILTQVSPRSHMPNVIDTVMDLPNINLSVIDEMIRIRRNHRDTTDDKELAKVSDSGIAVLEELKQRLSTNQ